MPYQLSYGDEELDYFRDFEDPLSCQMLEVLHKMVVMNSVKVGKSMDI